MKLFKKKKPVLTDEGIRLQSTVTTFNDKGTANGSLGVLKKASHVNGNFYKAAAVLFEDIVADARKTTEAHLTSLQAHGVGKDIVLTHQEVK